MKNTQYKNNFNQKPWYFPGSVSVSLETEIV